MNTITPIAIFAYISIFYYAVADITGLLDLGFG